MSFEYHSDVYDHGVFRAAGNAAIGLWVLAGTWTSRHQSPGFVPDRALPDLHDNPADEEFQGQITALVDAGIWTRVDGGYRMEFGPNNDWPLPVWRYGTTPPSNGMFEAIEEPDS